MRQIGFRIEVVVEPDGDTFHAYCPALKGLHTCGDTEEGAIQNAKDAAVAYLESSMKHGDSIPLGIMVQDECLPKRSAFSNRASRHTEELEVACPT
ncbi:MAG: type II toxin-antitoxin system HicB family antitoxin [Patescibacteria group bacterium]